MSEPELQLPSWPYTFPFSRILRRVAMHLWRHSLLAIRGSVCSCVDIPYETFNGNMLITCRVPNLKSFSWNVGSHIFLNTLKSILIINQVKGFCSNINLGTLLFCLLGFLSFRVFFFNFSDLGRSQNNLWKLSGLCTNLLSPQPFLWGSSCLYRTGIELLIFAIVYAEIACICLCDIRLFTEQMLQLAGGRNRGTTGRKWRTRNLNGPVIWKSRIASWITAVSSVAILLNLVFKLYLMYLHGLFINCVDFVFL